MVGKEETQISDHANHSSSDRSQGCSKTKFSMSRLNQWAAYQDKKE